MLSRTYFRRNGEIDNGFRRKEIVFIESHDTLCFHSQSSLNRFIQKNLLSWSFNLDYWLLIDPFPYTLTHLFVRSTPMTFPYILLKYHVRIFNQWIVWTPYCKIPEYHFLFTSIYSSYKCIDPNRGLSTLMKPKM